MALTLPNCPTPTTPPLTDGYAYCAEIHLDLRTGKVDAVFDVFFNQEKAESHYAAPSARLLSVLVSAGQGNVPPLSEMLADPAFAVPFAQLAAYLDGVAAAAVPAFAGATTARPWGG